ncbi:MAG: DUF5687 family protein, partial [Bacteroidota bacterium]
MFKHFIRLQWKSFFRSSSFGKGIALKILMIFFGIYMLAVLIGTGAGVYFILRELFPDQSPMWTISQYMVYWVLIELFFRYFLQKLPVMDIKPFLIVPINKSKITHYILGRSGVSIYNLFAIFFFIPFAIVLLFNGYAGLNVLLWLVSIFAIVL